MLNVLFVEGVVKFTRRHCVNGNWRERRQLNRLPVSGYVSNKTQ